MVFRSYRFQEKIVHKTNDKGPKFSYPWGPKKAWDSLDFPPRVSITLIGIVISFLFTCQNYLNLLSIVLSSQIMSVDTSTLTFSSMPLHHACVSLRDSPTIVKSWSMGQRYTTHMKILILISNFAKLIHASTMTHVCVSFI